MSHQELRRELELRAAELGFARVGIAAAVPSPGYDRLLEWIQRGYAGSMEYIPKRATAYRHPSAVLDGCTSVIMLAMPYASSRHTVRRKSAAREEVSSREEASIPPPSKIASYASGQVDYHDLIRNGLNSLCELLSTRAPGSSNRGVVDTAPLMERDFAQLAGLGWIGKNTLLLDRELGSYFFLAGLLTSIAFEVDAPFATDHCGSCTACIDACPTSAFVGPRLLNASRCISYLTIENHDAIEPELAARMDDWLFGCDVCQMVCPWNRKRQAVVPVPLQPIDLVEKTSIETWLEMNEATFRHRYRRTPFWRTKLTGMQRNALVVAGNTHRTDLKGTIKVFLHHPNKVLAQTAQWCLSRLLQ
jgi:epoxyqueuosine reductase